MSRLNFPDNPEAYRKEAKIINGIPFLFDGAGWTKQILSGTVILDVNNVSDDRLLPDMKGKDDEMLIYDEVEGWTGKNEIDGGTY